MASGYLIAVTDSNKSLETKVAIWNIAGRGKAICGFSNGMITTDLWVIPKGRRNRDEVIVLLQELPGILSVSVVALTDPVCGEESPGVRQLFADIGWDASEITDEELSLFINAKLRGEYVYYIDFDPRERVPRKIRIKRIEDHPNFSPDSLKRNLRTADEDPDREYTINDFQVSRVEFSINEEELVPPPPPAINDEQENHDDGNSKPF